MPSRPVVFYCPGTKEKPRHDCTPEAVSALVNVLEGQPTTVAFPQSPTITKPVTAEQAEQVEEERKKKPRTYTLRELKQKIGEERLRIQVGCRECATICILTDKLIREAKPRDERVDIDLLLPTPGDQALIKAAEGVSGLEALKASTANAAFVLGNLVLLTSLVTTLGLVKAEEIGSTLTEQKRGWLLVVAGVAGIGAVVFALWAQVVSTREINTGNLEEIRVFVKEEVGSRATLSKISLGLLALAAVVVAGAFLWTLLDRQTGAQPVGKLAVIASPATLDAGIETSWSGAEKGTRVLLTARTGENEPLLTEEKDTVDGAAEIKTSFQMVSSPTTAHVLIVITSALVKPVTTIRFEPVAGASKRQCLEIRPARRVTVADCP